MPAKTGVNETTGLIDDKQTAKRGPAEMSTLIMNKLTCGFWHHMHAAGGQRRWHPAVEAAHALEGGTATHHVRPTRLTAALLGARRKSGSKGTMTPTMHAAWMVEDAMRGVPPRRQV